MTVQDSADLVIGGEQLDPEHGLSVVEAAALLHEALKGEERGALKEETGEGSHGEIVQRVALIGALTRVWPALDGGGEQGDKCGEGSKHGALEALWQGSEKISSLYNYLYSNELRYMLWRRILELPANSRPN